MDGIPIYEFRIATAKLFLELNKPETAAEILKILSLEQDDVAEVWYLLGFAYSNNPDLAANVLHCCLTARDVSIPLRFCVSFMTRSDSIEFIRFS